MAGISKRKIRIMTKFRRITSVDGVEPRNRAAKTMAKIII